MARTSDDLIRYHGKYILIDRRVLYVLSFNFTHLDIDHSRGFGVVTSQPNCLQEAAKLFKADCTRTPYAPKVETFVVSPANSRRVLGTFLKRARKQLLIYDPKISDREMLRILQERAKAGVEVKVIGQVSGRASFEVQKLAGTRLHTRTIIRDRRQAFVGSQSLRTAELDSRREVGLIIQDPKAVKKLIDTFESDWTRTSAKSAPIPPDAVDAPVDGADRRVRQGNREGGRGLHEGTGAARHHREEGGEAGGGQGRGRRAPRQGRQGHDEAGRQAGGERGGQGRGSRRARSPAAEERRMSTKRWIRCRGGVRAGGPLPVRRRRPGCSPGQGAAPTKEQADDAAAFKEFSDRVQAYVKLQKTVESSLPALKPTDLPEMITAHQQALARKIREARPHAKPGDIFTPAACEAFRHASRPRSGARTRPTRARTCSRARPTRSCVWR